MTQEPVVELDCGGVLEEVFPGWGENNEIGGYPSVRELWVGVINKSSIQSGYKRSGDSSEECETTNPATPPPEGL